MTTTPVTLSYATPANPQPANQILYLNVLRAVAITLVLLTHCATPILKAAPGDGDWWAACIYNAISRCCVPLFVMISGALLLDPTKSEPLSAFFAKRIMKVLIPFLVWSAIYLCFRAWLDADRVVKLVEHPLDALRQIISAGAFYHLWFVYVILGLYLATPILRVYLIAATPRDLYYFLSVWFVGTCLLPIVAQYLHFELRLEFFVAEGWAGYFMLGHALRQGLFNFSRRTLVYALLGSIVFTVAATGFLSRFHFPHHLDATFFDYQTPNVALMSAAAFLLCRQLPHERWQLAFPGTYRLIALLSVTSWGVYLAHLLFLETVQSDYLGHRITGASHLPAILGIPALTLLTLAVTTTAVWLLRRLPVLRAIVP